MMLLNSDAHLKYTDQYSSQFRYPMSVWLFPKNNIININKIYLFFMVFRVSHLRMKKNFKGIK